MITFKRLFLESSLSRVYQHYLEHDSGTISAFRGNNDLNTNKKLSNKLKQILLQKGFSVTPIDGVYIENYKSDNAREVAEESFIVVDMHDTGKLSKTLQVLGNQFKQDSITFSEKNGEYYLIGTSPYPDVFPGTGKWLKLGKPMFGENGEFYSKINNRPFIFK